jgi:hypothetical protein
MRVNNEAPREGLARLEEPAAPDTFTTRVVSLGRPRMSLADVSQALEFAEGHGLT